MDFTKMRIPGTILGSVVGCWITDAHAPAAGQAVSPERRLPLVNNSYCHITFFFFLLHTCSHSQLCHCVPQRTSNTKLQIILHNRKKRVTQEISIIHSLKQIMVEISQRQHWENRHKKTTVDYSVQFGRRACVDRISYTKHKHHHGNLFAGTGEPDGPVRAVTTCLSTHTNRLSQIDFFSYTWTFVTGLHCTYFLTFRGVINSIRRFSLANGLEDPCCSKELVV